MSKKSAYGWIKDKVEQHADNATIYKMYDSFLAETDSQMHYDSFKRRIRAQRSDVMLRQPLQQQKNAELTDPEVSTKMHLEGDKSHLSIDVLRNKDIKNPAELVEYTKEIFEKLAKDLPEYKLGKPIINYWEMKAVIDGEVTPLPCWQIKMPLVPLTVEEEDLREELEQFKKELIDYAPQYRTVYYKPEDRTNLFVFSLFDHHLGQLADARETGSGDYNNDTALSLARDASKYMMHWMKEHSAAEILIWLGHDFFNVDNKFNTTTKGTAQDNDGLYKSNYLNGRDFWIKTIEDMSHIAPVVVRRVPGNHDETVTFHLCDALECQFHNNENVEIDNGLRFAKFHRWGDTLLGGVHKLGRRVTVGDFFRSERREDTGQCRWLELHEGHFHDKSMAMSGHMGNRRRVLPSLVDLDAWHSEAPYKALRETVGLVYDLKKGFHAEYAYRV